MLPSANTGTSTWVLGNVGDDIPLAQSDIAAAEDIKSIDKTWDVTNT